MSGEQIVTSNPELSTGEVKKRTGKTEAFDVDKVRKSIQKAVIDAGLPVGDVVSEIDDLTAKLLVLAKRKDALKTDEIRRRILLDFDATDDRVATSWRTFERRYKRRII